MNPQEELRGFLDNDQFVSFRWLATFLDIHVEAAKSILEAFKSSNNDVSATYCLSGRLKNKQQSISVVSEKNLAKCKELFEVINCTHIYSLQKNKFSESESVPQQLNAADVQQANELIALQPPCLTLLQNSIGGVKLNGCEIKPLGKRAAAIVREVIANDSSAANIDGGISKSFAAAGNGGKDKNGAASSSSSGKDSSKDKGKEKAKASTSMASAFFAKSSSAAATGTVKAEIIIASPIKAAKSAPAAKASVSLVEPKSESKKVGDDDEDDDDEWTEEGAARYKPDKKKLKSRKDVSSSTAATEQLLVPSSAGPMRVDEDVEAESGVSRAESRKVPVHVHGAMDDYMEDVAIEQYKAGQTADVDESAASGDAKRTTRKLVEKMYEDAKGYLITEMVWEEVPFEDEVAPTRPTTSTLNPAPGPSSAKRPITTDSQNEEEDREGSDKKVKSKPAVPAKKAKKAAPVVQQKGMMSFFGKK